MTTPPPVLEPSFLAIQLQIVYEAGPCGYTLARELHSHGFACEVVAPAKIARRPLGPHQDRSARRAAAGAGGARRGAGQRHDSR